jgi:hypothetical protein
MKAVDKYFPSRFLRASMIEKPVVLTIEGTEDEDIDGETRLMVNFLEIEQHLVLNKTNFVQLVKILGQEDPVKWKAQKIELYVAEISFKGEPTQAIRIRVPKVKEAG